MAASNLCTRSSIVIFNCSRGLVSAGRANNTGSGPGGGGTSGGPRRYLQSSSNKNYNQAAARPLVQDDQQELSHESIKSAHSTNPQYQHPNCPQPDTHKPHQQKQNNNYKPPEVSQHHQPGPTKEDHLYYVNTRPEVGAIVRQDRLDLTFNDTESAFQSKTMKQLFRSFFVLGLCSSDFLVKNNERLMKLSRMLMGRHLFYRLMSATFYGQFVAGEDEHKIRPIIEHLSSFGVKSILDYSAEEDINEEEVVQEAIGNYNKNKLEQQALQSTDGLKKYQQSADFVDRRKFSPVARTYFYHGESQCEKNLESFFKSIDAVAHSTNGTGLAAVKLTALGRPRLLMKLSKMIEFVKQDAADKTDAAGNKSMLSIVDDILDRFNRIDQNQLKSLSEDEEEMLRQLMRRVNRVAEYAREKRVRFMIDAEQTYLQQAINLIAMQLMRQFNTSQAIVFNTYQCYLRSAQQQVKRDLALARAEGFYFGAKLVRGAYMEQERARATRLRYPDPINASYEDTTSMYEQTLSYLMNEIIKTDNSREWERKVSIMVASHNEDTVRYTVNQMRALGISPEHRVICFGQLYGMCDHVSFTLGQSGYSVYKYLPYGPVEEVLPYLARRATENHGIMDKVQRERSLLRRELFNRFKQMKFFYQPVGHYRPV